MKMVFAASALVAATLLSCGERLQTKSVAQAVTKPSATRVTRWTEIAGVPHTGLHRFENDEVICYWAAGVRRSGFQCRWKTP